MKRAGILIFAAGLWAASPALAESAALSGAACPAASEAECMLEAAWIAAQDLPQEKRARVRPLFVPLALKLTGATAKARWDARLGDTEVEMPYEDYVRRTAESVVRESGWEGFVRLARDGAAPLHMGRPEIMAAAIEFAPDRQQRARLIEMMFFLAGTPDTAARGTITADDFERADFGHVLAERMMRDCNLAEFNRAVALTSAPDALRYRLWRAQITGGAGKLAGDIRAGDGTDDTSHVRQALEGYGAILSLGYCPKQGSK